MPISTPPGTSQAFQSTVRTIADATQSGEWDQARALLNRLPSQNVTVEWREAELPEGQRPMWKEARDEAFVDWMRAIKGLKIELGANPGVLFSFVEKLPPAEGESTPAGAVYFVSPSADEVRLEAVLSLNRSLSNLPVRKREVHNEVSFAMGAYFGLARAPNIGSVMFRIEGFYPKASMVTIAEAKIVLSTLRLSNQIRQAVADRKVIALGEPRLFVTPTKLTPKPVLQAEPMAFSIQISNRGTAPLEFYLVPDCNCFRIGKYEKVVSPGKTVIVPIQINTINFVGELHKTLVLFSNDSSAAVTHLKMDTVVTRAYEFLDPKGVSTVLLTDSGAVHEVYLAIEPGVELKPTKIAVSGMSVEVYMEEFSGTVQFGPRPEDARKIEGYKVSLLFKPTIPLGQMSVSIQIATAHPIFRTLVHNLQVQKGIVATPRRVYFGEIVQGVHQAWTLLVRPGKPFKILRVETSSNILKAEVIPMSDPSKYRIVVKYMGNAPIGGFREAVIVYTDDPDQPEIRIPVEGVVR
ncbi:MAG: DUF1573 domain-containing protein [Armatimonadetes bacterium]|nr:DUF1573 domain-containing protein [Armatimonadota bacterium]